MVESQSKHGAQNCLLLMKYTRSNEGTRDVREVIYHVQKLSKSQVVLMLIVKLQNRSAERIL